MKKIIAFTSFLFLFLLAVLPGQATHAAANNAPVISGISLVTDKGEIKAVKNGDSFTFDLKGLADQKISAYKFTSDTAKTVSFVPYDDKMYSDDTDLQFVNGVATLDKQKFINWLNRVSVDDPQFASNFDPTQIDPLFTIQGIRDMFAEDGNGQAMPFYVADGNGNTSEISLIFNIKGWKYNKGWYYYNDQGKVAKGWLQDEDGQWYYLNPTTGLMTTGWVNWKNQWFLLKSNGVMATGWAQDKGKWYYLNPTTGAMATGWVKDGTKWYYLTKSGAMATGWVFYKSQWYYLNSPSGVMATGWVSVGGKWYYLYSDGHMAKNVKIGSHKVDSHGVRIY